MGVLRMCRNLKKKEICQMKGVLSMCKEYNSENSPLPEAQEKIEPNLDEIIAIHSLEAQIILEPTNSSSPADCQIVQGLNKDIGLHLPSSGQPPSHRPSMNSAKPPLPPKPRQTNKRYARKMVEKENWPSFVKDIESEEDRAAEARDLRNKQIKEKCNSSKSPSSPSISSLEAKKTWALGKELGLEAKESDEVIEQELEKLELQRRNESGNVSGDPENVNQ